MIPTLFTGGVLIAPGSSLISTGYVAGNTLGAQHFNWYLYHLTAELNNLLTGVGISQSTGDDQQVMKAVGRAQVSITATGTTTASAFTGDTWVKYNNSGGAATYDISAGAVRAGVLLFIEEIHANGVTIQTGSGMTAFLGVGEVTLLWDGVSWAKVGGATLLKVFTSGSGATWKTPWKGSYKVTVAGSGAGGGGWTSGPGGAGSGGAAGGTAISVLYEAAGATFTYTVGASVSQNTGGNNSTLADGTVTLTGNGGSAGVFSTSSSAAPSGGTASGGQENIEGSAGGTAYAAAFSFGGHGGSSYKGGGGHSASSAGNTNGENGRQYGAGGGGCTGTGSGGNGSSGLVEVEF